MPLRTVVDATTTSGGAATVTVEGKVVDQGPGAGAGYVCDVIIFTDKEKLELDGSPEPGGGIQDPSGISVWWQAVPITTTESSFKVHLKWKAGASGMVLATIQAFDAAQEEFVQDVVWLKRSNTSTTTTTEAVERTEEVVELEPMSQPLKGVEA